MGTEVEMLDDSASIDSRSQQGGDQCGWRAARVGPMALPPPWDTYEIREGHVTVRLTRGAKAAHRIQDKRGDGPAEVELRNELRNELSRGENSKYQLTYYLPLPFVTRF